MKNDKFSFEVYSSGQNSCSLIPLWFGVGILYFFLQSFEISTVINIILAVFIIISLNYFRNVPLFKANVEISLDEQAGISFEWREQTFLIPNSNRQIAWEEIENYSFRRMRYGEMQFILQMIHGDEVSFRQDNLKGELTAFQKVFSDYVDRYNNQKNSEVGKIEKV